MPATRNERSVSPFAARGRRNLTAYARVPQLLIVTTIQPVTFVLLSRHAFGGAASLPGFRYPDAVYLMPGHLRADGGVWLHRHSDRHGHRCPQRADRALPGAADVAAGRAAAGRSRICRRTCSSPSS